MPKRLAKGGYEFRDSPFFQMKSRKKLAKLLQTTPATLKTISENEEKYVRRWKHKEQEVWLKVPPQGENSEEFRPIDIPDSRLKAIQSRIANLLSRIAPPEFLYSPVKGRSYVDNAAAHIGSHAFWLLDMADYFPSCSASNVARFFGKDLRCSPDVTAILTKIVTWNGSLPQGSPCSPILAYYANRPLWEEVRQLVHRTGCKFSLYADDITISGPVIPKRMIWNIKKAVFKHGLRLKNSKEVSLISKPAEITGVIVRGDRTMLPNRKLKLLAELRKTRRSTRNRKLRNQLDNQIAGRLSQRRQVERA